MSKVIQIQDVAELNRATYKRDEFPAIVNYLDTSSLTKNRIEGFQILNTNTDEIPSRAQRKVKRNTILYSTVRPNQEHYGIIENHLEDVIVSTGFTTLDVFDETINPKYLYYLLTQPQITEYLHTIASNSVSAYPSILPSDLGNLTFRIPELSTQNKIASVLSALDSKIELNNRINAELEAMAKTLYDYWFVQFDFPDKNGKPYKSSGGKMVWNEELKREVPEGWGIEKMKEVLTIKNGRDHKHLELGTIPVYGSGGIMRYANNSIYDSESILIPRKGTLSNLFYVNEPFWCVDTIFYTQMKFPHTCKYLYYTIRAFNISSMNTGTAVPSMTTEILNNLLLIFPSLEILRDFDKILNPIFQKVDKLKLENQKLSELRDWLLPMLMNGQVKVKEVEHA